MKILEVEESTWDDFDSTDIRTIEIKLTILHRGEECDLVIEAKEIGKFNHFEGSYNEPPHSEFISSEYDVNIILYTELGVTNQHGIQERDCIDILDEIYEMDTEHAHAHYYDLNYEY